MILDDNHLLDTWKKIHNFKNVEFFKKLNSKYVLEFQFF